MLLSRWKQWVMMLDKLVITKWNGKVLSALISDGQAVQLNVETEDGQSILNNIYIGKVKNIVKNINAAFVDIGEGRMGYYSLTDNRYHHIVTSTGKSKLKAGDEIIVQVERDAVKSKAPVLTANLNFTGKYCVLTAGKKQIGFSNKITDQEWKKNLKPYLESEKSDDFGIIIRTNAEKAGSDTIIEELRQLKEVYKRVITEGSYRTCFSLLYQALPFYIAGIRDSFSPSLTEILTDDPEIYQALNTYLETEQPGDKEKLKFYDDPLLPLPKLYQIDTVMERAVGRHVWLKSGGYLVIEPTEALTVIDVNTGKYAGKKNLRDTIMKINMEAAAESARQIRLRNLSGIIIIDFIDMELEEDKRFLMNHLSELLSNDPVKTSVVDMTKLNLVEITRKKIRKPLYEQIS